MASSSTADRTSEHVESFALTGGNAVERGYCDADTASLSLSESTSGVSNRLWLFTGRVIWFIRRYHAYIVWTALATTVVWIHWSDRSLREAQNTPSLLGDDNLSGPSASLPSVVNGTLIDVENDYSDGDWTVLPTENIYAVDSVSNALYIVNARTNQRVGYIGRLGGDDLERYTFPVSLVVHPLDGRIFLWNIAPSEDYGLSIVDPSTGLATRLGVWEQHVTTLQTILSHEGQIGSLLFHKSQLYAIYWHLYVLDLTESVARHRCSLGMPISAATVDPEHGIMYGVTYPADFLVTIDPNSCEVTIVAKLSERSGRIGALLWDSERKSILGSALNGVLFDLDPSNATVSNIRSGETPQSMAWGVPSGWTAQPTMAPSSAPTPTVGARTMRPSRDFTRGRLLYGVMVGTRKLFTMNADTGKALEIIGTVGGDESGGYKAVVAMTRHQDGRLFVWNNDAGSNQGLAVLDPATGLTTRPGPWRGVQNALTFGVDGLLYAASEDLYVIDLVESTATQGCTLGVTINAMMTDFESGIMYGISMSKRELVTIDSGSCAVTVVGQLAEEVGWVSGILWDPERGLILGSSKKNFVFDLDPLDATVSNIRGRIGPQNMVWVDP